MDQRTSSTETNRALRLEQPRPITETGLAEYPYRWTTAYRFGAAARASMCRNGSPARSASRSRHQRDGPKALHVLNRETRHGIEIKTEREGEGVYQLTVESRIVGFALKPSNSPWALFEPDKNTRLGGSATYANPKAAALALGRRGIQATKVDTFVIRR